MKPATSIAFGMVAAVGFAYLFIKYDEGDVTLETTLDFLGVGRGRKLNNSSMSYVNAEGKTVKLDYVPTSPNVLISEAEQVLGVDIDRDVYALARSGRSEGVNGMEARMHVMVNQAREAGLSVFELTVRRSGYEGDGFFGIQKHRRWASSRDPYEGDIGLATKVIIDNSAGKDTTGGASRFVDKSAFGKQEGTRTYAEVKAKWGAEGYEAYRYPDASSDFVLFRRGGVPDGFEPV